MTDQDSLAPLPDLGGYSKACGPAALAALAGISRDEAARLLAELDPPKGRGWTRTSTMLTALDQLGLRTEYKMPSYDIMSPPTLARWVQDRAGLWLVLVGRGSRSHFVVVRHGQIVEDNRVSSARRRIATAYQVTDPNRPGYSSDRPSWPTCRCGCGQTVHRDRYYRAGHDARHLSILASAVRDGQLAVRAAMYQLDHSPALRDKLQHRLSRLPERLDASTSDMV